MQTIAHPRPTPGQPRLLPGKPASPPPGHPGRLARTLKTWIALSFLLLGAGLNTLVAANLLTNPGFEAGQTGWSNPNLVRGGTSEVIIAPTLAHSGNNCISNNNPAGWSSAEQGDSMGGWSTGVSLPISDAKYYQLAAWVKVPGASTTPQAITLRYRFEPSGARVDVGTRTVTTESWTLLETGWIQPPAGSTFMSYWEVHSLNNGVIFYADDCALNESDPYTITGKVVDGSNAGVDGATVTAYSGAAIAPSTTTAGGGFYTLTFPPTPGTWSVRASTPGYKGSVSVVVAASSTPAPNLALAADPNFDPTLILSAASSAIPLVGLVWPTTEPASGIMAPLGTPGVQSFGGVQWEKNVADGPGYLFGTYTDPIPVNGASIVAVAKPKRMPSNNWDSIVDVFYNRLVLGIRNDTGVVNVWRNGTLDFSTAAIPDGQVTVLSLVVQPTGEYKVWVNGVEIMNVTTTSDMTSLVPNVPGAYANAINVGRNNADTWTTFNGNIGDVYLYNTALDDAKRVALQNSLLTKFITNATLSYTINASAGANGSISPVGATSVVQGYDQTYTITGNAGFVVSSVLVDGVSVGAVTSYTFSNVAANHTIAATFVAMPPQTITATSGPNGAINPLGAVSVAAGGDQTFTITPNSGYAVSSVVVDGVSKGEIYSYTFPFVVAPHTISVTFRALSMNIPKAGQIIFSVVTDSLPGDALPTGNWATYVPSGKSLAVIGGNPPPSVEVIGGIKWEKNVAATVGGPDNGFQWPGGGAGGAYTSAIYCTGASIVVVAKPLIDANLTGPWDSLVDVFYDRLVLGIKNDTGEIVVRYAGGPATYGPAIPYDQPTVLSMVVQPDGSYKVWANTALVMTGSGAPLTSLVPGGAAHEKYINLGRNQPDGWTAFNGNIGDAFLYQTALTATEREQLEGILMTKFGAPLPPVFKWKGPNLGNWSVAANWNSAVPSSGNTAVFSDSAGSGANVLIDTPAMVGGVLFNNLVPNSTLLSSGGNSLTFDNGINAAMVTVDAGSHSINAPIIATTKLQKIGAGTLTLGGTNTSASAGLQAAEGTLVLAGESNTYGMSGQIGLDVYNGAEARIITATTLPDGSGTHVANNGRMAITGTYVTSGADQIIGAGDHGGGPGTVTLSGTGSWTHSGSGVFVIGNNVPANTGKVIVNDNALLSRPGNPLWLAVGWDGGSTGIIEQNGGTVMPVQTAENWRNSYGPGIMLGQWADTPCHATYSLNGGVLQTPSIGSVAWDGGANKVVDPSTKGSTAVINLNGGVVKASASDLTDTDAIEEGTAHLIFNTTHTWVQAGGAKIDTDGQMNSIAVSLEHDASGPAVDGGLTKMGLGTLTLLKASTYTGPTKVQAGILACSLAAALGGGAVDISAGAKLQLTYVGTRAVAQLTFNGGAAEPAGTYGATGSGAAHIDDVHFTGTGTLTVGPAPTPVLSSSAITMSGGVASLSFPTVAGYKYRLVYKDVLTAAAWQPVIAAPNNPAPEGWSAPSTGSPMTINDAGTAGQPQRFYRVQSAIP